jgi:hypothetical protein
MISIDRIFARVIAIVIANFRAANGGTAPTDEQLVSLIAASLSAQLINP